MAVLDYFLADAADSGWQRLSTATQVAATIVGGWVVSTGATNHSAFEQGVERAATTFADTTPPAAGGPGTTLNESFRSETPLSGDFASGNWVFHFVVRAVSNGGAQDGRVRFRLYKADADGSNPTEITSGQQQASIVTNVSTSADFDSTLTVNPGAFSIANQHLFIQVAWERTGAGGMTNSDINFRTGVSSSEGTRITTADFTEAAAPFVGQTWSVPAARPSLAVAVLTIASAGLALTAAPEAQPFAQTDWPVPARRPALVTTVDIKPADEEPRIPAQTDWPLPQPKAWAIDLRTWTQSPQTSALTPPEAPPFHQTDWPIPRGRANQVVVLTDMQPAEAIAGTPIRPPEWPTPRGPQYPIVLRTWVQPRPSFYVEPVAVMPIAQLDWPLPRARPARHVGFVEYFALDDTVPAVRQEWPTIRPVPSALLRTWTQNLLESTLFTPPAPMPFRQTEWPTPREPEYPITLRTWLDGRKIFHVDIKPFLQTDWPVPRGPVPILDLRTWVQNIVGTTLAQPNPKPFFQNDWPLPIGRSFPIALRTWTDARELFLVDLKPFAQTDWPLPAPRPSARELRTWLQNLLETTLAPAAAPFAPNDWPIPIGRPFPIALRTWIDTRERVLVDQKPFAQTEWPLPAWRPVRAYEIRLYTWTHGASALTIPEFQPLAPAWSIRVPEWPQTILVVETPQIIVVPEWPDDVEIP